MDPSTVGLALSYALTLQTNLNRFVTMFSETETSMVSVERIMEYQNAPQEAPFSIPEQGPYKQHTSWDTTIYRVTHQLGNWSWVDSRLIE